MHLPDYTCVLCHLLVDEDLAHLLFHCPFATACWFSISMVIPGTSDPGLIVESLRAQLGQPFFMEIVVTMCWSIWMMRNDVIFKGLPHSIQRCKDVFRKEVAVVKFRAKSDIRPSLDLWLQSHL
jgi:hypothetical protein